jgi:AAA+ superfamily predicted ATPase
MDKERMAAVRISTDFNSLLEETNFEEGGKNSVQYIVDFFRKGHPDDFMYKTALFHGNYGSGKSFFAAALAEHLGVETVYRGRDKPCVKGLVICRTLEDIIAAINNDRKQLILLDNAHKLFRIVESSPQPAVHPEDAEKYWSILDILDSSKNKLMISVSSNNVLNPAFSLILQNSKICVRFQNPSVPMKREALNSLFGAHLSQDKIKFIAGNSIGYGFGDLFGVIREAYINGHSFSMASIESAMRSYLPFTSRVAKIYHNVPIRFSDIIGKQKAMRIIRKVADAYSGGKSVKFGISRGNLLLFHGMHGTGKSFVAKAIAGETGKFLISVRPDALKEEFDGLEAFIDILKNYENSIVFIDEAEKLLKAHDSIEGFLNDIIDGADTNTIKGMLILAVNDISVLDPALLDRFVKIEFEPPILEERLQFCKMKKDALEEGIRDIIDIDALAKHTDGKSYRDIDRVWNELMFHHIDTGEALDAKKVKGIILKMDEMSSKKISMYG